MRGGLDSCRYGVYWLLILRDQPVVGGLGLICPVAASGHNYLALVRQGGLNPLTLPAHYKAQEFNLHLEEQAFFEVGVKAELPESLKDFSNVSPEILQIL